MIDCWICFLLNRISGRSPLWNPGISRYYRSLHPNRNSPIRFGLFLNNCFSYLIQFQRLREEWIVSLQAPREQQVQWASERRESIGKESYSERRICKDQRGQFHCWGECIPTVSKHQRSRDRNHVRGIAYWTRWRWVHSSYLIIVVFSNLLYLSISL